jgi:hypothetical protein
MNRSLDFPGDPRAKNNSPHGGIGLRYSAPFPAHAVGKKRHHAPIKLHAVSAENNIICLFPGRWITARDRRGAGHF